MTLYRIQCFRVNLLKNCSMFSMSQCFSIFFNFFNFFGQKRSSNFNFRTNFTLLIKNRKPNLIFAYPRHFFCYLKTNNIWKNATLKHWSQHWNIENIESNSMLKFWKTLTSHWVSMFIFLHQKHWIEINVNVGADPLSCSCKINLTKSNLNIVLTNFLKNSELDQKCQTWNSNLMELVLIL